MEDSGSKAGRTRRPAAKTSAAATGNSAAPGQAPAARRAVVPRAPAASAAPLDRDEMVRVAAYFRALRRGFAPGYEVADWLEAQAEVDEIMATAVASRPRKSAAKKRSAD